MSIFVWKIILWSAPIVGVLVAVIAQVNIHRIENRPIVVEVLTDIIANPIDHMEITDGDSQTWNKIALGLRIGIKPELRGNEKVATVGLIFLSADRLYDTQSRLSDWMTESITFGERPAHHRILHRSFNGLPLTSTNFSNTGWFDVTLSVDHVPWKAAFYVIIGESSPQWFQLTIENGHPRLVPRSGSGVSVRDYELEAIDEPIVKAGSNPLFNVDERPAE